MIRIITLLNVICILFGSCSTRNGNSENSTKDTVFVYDTIIIENINLAIPPQGFKSQLYDFYNFISVNNIDEACFSKLDDNYIEEIIRGILWDESNMNKMIVLFFIKLHYSSLMKNSNVGYNLSCCRNEHPSLSLFSLQFYKISKFDPREILLTGYIYQWVLTQPKYKNDELIKEVVLKIEKIITEKNLKFPHYYELKPYMFNE